MSAAERAYAEAIAQGLPERIADPHTLDRVATLLANGATPARKAGAADASSGPGRGVRHAQV